MVVRNFKDLVVWQKSFDLCTRVYRTTQNFPSHERFGLTSELRKTVRSVLYNVAEGYRRASTREYIRFLDIARGSAAELETQLLLSLSLGYLDEATSEALLGSVVEKSRMLTVLMRRLRQKIGTGGWGN
jgi:four helix bundle protein